MFLDLFLGYWRVLKTQNRDIAKYARLSSSLPLRTSFPVGREWQRKSFSVAMATGAPDQTRRGGGEARGGLPFTEPAPDPGPDTHELAPPAAPEAKRHVCGRGLSSVRRKGRRGRVFAAAAAAAWKRGERSDSARAAETLPLSQPRRNKPRGDWPRPPASTNRRSLYYFRLPLSNRAAVEGEAPPTPSLVARSLVRMFSFCVLTGRGEL